MDEEPRFPPLRTLDDFIVGGARFGPPDFANQDKWSNRVLQNLMYYQSNYFIMIGLVVMCCFYLQPLVMMYGFLVFCAAIAYLQFAFQNWYNEITKLRKDNPTGYLALVLFHFAAAFYATSKMAMFLLSVLLPVLLILIHSSFRMRNFNNKIQNKVEAIGLKKSLMGHLLEKLTLI